MPSPVNIALSSSSSSSPSTTSSKTKWQKATRTTSTTTTASSSSTTPISSRISEENNIDSTSSTYYHFPQQREHNEEEEEQVVDFEIYIITMLLSILWLITISISTANHHVEAFTRAIQSKLNAIQNDPSIQQHLERMQLHDLSPPFQMDVDLIDEDENSGGESNHNVIINPDITHFCFLCHGHRGLSKDLTYMQVVMKRWAAVEKKKKKSDEDSTEEEENEEEMSNRRIPYDLVIHNSVCNEGKTTDGIINGGNRLVEEIRQVIEREIKRRHPDDDPDDKDILYDISFSMLGNSLGGLYARYAVAELISSHCELEDPTDVENSCWILDGKYRMYLNIFCTTASPHLGVSRHTYVRIPRTAETVVAHAMGETGRDLFRVNDLLKTMATTSKFLGPLSKFRKRIAYANAYGTDFPVPARTAAFLSENSTYPHLFEEEDLMVDESGYVIATVHTPPEKKGVRELEVGDTDDSETFEDNPTDQTLMIDDRPPDDDNHEEQLHQMSLALDKLGWKKVFVDIRQAIPSIEVPTSLMMRRQNSNSRLNVSDDDSERGGEGGSSTQSGNNNSHNIDTLKESKKAVESRDIASAVRYPVDNRYALPLGHNMIVAFSRSRISTYMNKGGRPIVDALGKELVEDIFSWNAEEKAEKAATAAAATTTKTTSRSV